MPIETRELKHIRPQRDGSVRVQEVLTSSKGQKILHAYSLVVQSDPVAVQNFTDAAAIVKAAHKRLEQAKKDKDAVRVATALVDIQDANTSMQAPYDALVAVAAAEGIVIMNARDVTEQLRGSDFNELLDWVKAKNGSDTFDYVDRDITELEGEEFLLIWFGETIGDSAIPIAWWVEDMNPSTYSAIRIRAGFDSDQGSFVQDKAIALAAVEPFIEVIVSPG